MYTSSHINNALYGRKISTLFFYLRYLKTGLLIVYVYKLICVCVCMCVYVCTWSFGKNERNFQGQSTRKSACSQNHFEDFTEIKTEMNAADYF